jgi:hypothetical protein
MSNATANGPPRQTKAAYEAAEEKPRTLPINPDGIPAELKALPQWVCWKWERRQAKNGAWRWTKVPVNPRTLDNAKANDPTTWGTFAAAFAHYQRDPASYAGVGFEFSVNDPFCGVDLDDCRNRETGEVDEWARADVQALDTYTEVSPSGTGTKSIVRGYLPPTGRNRKPHELYDSGHFFALTGQRVPGTPPTCEARQAELTALHQRVFGRPREPRPEPPKGKASGGQQSAGLRSTVRSMSPAWSKPYDQLTDDDLITLACECRPGRDFKALWNGDTSLFGGDESRCDASLCTRLAFWCRRDKARVDRLFRGSGLMRPKWDEVHYADGSKYGEETVRRACEEWCSQDYKGPDAEEEAAEGAPADGTAQPPPAWELPTPLTASYPVPPFPVHLLPGWAAEWATAIARATQTPGDLAAMLVLAVAGAALAGKFRLTVRDGWTEPLNLFVVVALLVGERKSAVFREAMEPVREFEAAEQAEAVSRIAEKASEHRVLEGQVKNLEAKAAKETDDMERMRLKQEAARVARDLAEHKVPVAPEMFCEDVTPEKLANKLAQHGGRMLQASAEGTAFEIAKGRYSESPNFDVYLKGHAGDPLRVARISRDGDTVDQPALSMALAVQPDVIQGLAEQATMRARGFLARWIYALPASLVGSRTVRPAPVPPEVHERFRTRMLALWALKGGVDEHGRPAPHWLHLEPIADGHIEALERWLEPQLAEGEELAHLGGWANKLAGTVARIAGILHMMGEVERGGQPGTTVNSTTTSAAVQIGRDYALPHALAAFGLMGADKRAEDAKKVWNSIRRRCECSEYSESAPPCLSRRDIHQANRRTFPSAEHVDAVLDLLVKEGYLLLVGGSGQPGKGHKSPQFWVNPLALAQSGGEPPRTHRTHRTHSEADDVPGDACED